MANQNKKLLNSLVLVVENLRNPEALGAVLNALGARHVSYGATPKNYLPVGEALITTFEQYLQQDWAPEVKQAGCIPFLQEHLAIGNRGYRNEVRLRGLNASLRRQALFV